MNFYLRVTERGTGFFNFLVEVIDEISMKKMTCGRDVRLAVLIGVVLIKKCVIESKSLSD